MDNSGKNQQKSRIIAASISIIIHIFLLLFKLLIGVLTNSLSIIALAADSGFDIIAAYATYWGIRKISKPADKDHNYGHGKYEFLASGIQGIILYLTAVLIIIDAIFRLIFGAEITVNIFSFIVMIVGIGLNIFLAIYLSKISKKTKSLALEANSINSISDILNYIIVFISLFFILYLNLGIIDGIVAIIVSIFIIRGGYILNKKSLSGLLDKIPPEVKLEKIKSVINSVPGVKNAHSIRLRSSGPYIFMDSVIQCDGAQSVEQAHNCTEMVETSLKKNFPDITDIVIHVEPMKTFSNQMKNKIRKKVLEIKEIKRCHHIHFGTAGNSFILDLHVIIDGRFSLDYAHKITEKVEKYIKEELEKEFDLKNVQVLVHPEPYNDLDQDQIINEIIEITENISSVENCHNVKIRIEEKEILINMHVSMRSNMNIEQAHQISEIIEKIIETNLKEKYPKKGFDINIHVEPKNLV